MDATGQGDKLSQGAGEFLSCTIAGSFYSARQVFFSGAEIDQHFQTFFGQLPRYNSVTLWRPLFRSPACSGIQQRDSLCAVRFQAKLALLLGSSIMWEFSGRQCHPPMSNCFRE